MSEREIEHSMVDISPKPSSYREAWAVGEIVLKPSTLDAIRQGKIEKGDPFPAAKLAAILAAKRTSSIIPMCHTIPLSVVEVDFQILDKLIRVRSLVKATWKTGVEMEALLSTTTALLTLWDMVKQYEKDDEGQYPDTRIQNIRVEKKIKVSLNE